MVDFSQVTEIMLGSSVVEQIANSQGVVLWSKAGDDPANSYFYVEDISGLDNTLSIVKNRSSAPTIEVFKSSDGTNWESMGNTDTTEITATIPANGKLYLKATANSWNSSEYNKISASGAHNVGGNIMSLLYGDNFIGKTSFPSGSSYNFNNLFHNNRYLISANDLALPATTLADWCYSSMFSGCTSLTQAPALPAMTLANTCYFQMFYDCTALTQAPALPATTLVDECYEDMFNGCTSLTQAPALPATTLANYCYQSMFRGCTSLTQAPELPVTTLANNCYCGMFQNCTSLTTAPALPATTLVQGCYSSMFNGCTSLTQAPALPAMTLADGCYSFMFQDCTSLTQTPALPATTLADYCYIGMFNGCTSLTQTPALPATTLAEGCYYYMFQGCTALNRVTTYATDISATNCLNNWLNGVSSTGDFYNLGGATYPTDSASGIPTGWTEHTTGSTINVTITNTSNYSGATYQIDDGTVEPINETGTTSFIISPSATTLTVNRNGKGVTEMNGVQGITSTTDRVAVIPVNKMTTNVSIDLVNLM